MPTERNAPETPVCRAVFGGVPGIAHIYGDCRRWQSGFTSHGRMRRRLGSSRATLASVAILHQMGYEGSPPLWHLLLWGLIRLHLPYAALGAVSLTLVAAGMYIWLRWSPLPAPVRLLVPFAFYYQYQYAVVARSYALSDLARFRGGCALESEAGSRDSPWVGCCIAGTNQHVRIHDRWRNCLRVCLGILSGLPQTASFANANLSDQRSRVFSFWLPRPLPGLSPSHFQIAVSGRRPNFKREPRLASIARGLGGLPELSTALGLNMTWGLSLLLIVTIWAIAIKKRTFVLPLIATLALGIPDEYRTYHFLRNRREHGSADSSAVLVFCGKAASLCSSVPLYGACHGMGLV